MTSTPRLSNQTIFVRYVAIAAGSSLANLAVQLAAVRLWPTVLLMVSILAGTAVGFVIKYVLDKLYVFNDSYAGVTQETRKLLLYGFTAIFTTLLFWAIEALFWYASYDQTIKLIGGAIGLSLGNLAKYFLDRRYAFGSASTPAAALVHD
jgi:putative flippase GtrA